MSAAYMNRARGRSLSQQPNDDELLSIEKQSEFINMTFKYTINDLENVIAMLRARFTAEEAYLTSLYKVRKMAYANDGERTNLNHDARATFQTAVKIYEATVIDMINSRHRLRDTIKAEIDNLVKQKEQEELNRKNFKSRLVDANLNYTTFRTRDIIKLHKAYLHKCEDLKMSQGNWQQQQQQQLIQQQQAAQATQQQQQQQQQQAYNTQGQFKYSQDENNDYYYKSSRNSADLSRLSGEYTSRDMDGASVLSFNNSSDQHNKKGVVGLLSQMRTRASGNTYMAPLDQNKQNTKVAKLKKDITDADNEYREGILVLESLRKKQTKTTEEVNKQLKFTIKRKTDAVQNSLTNILQSELETLKVEIEISSASYAAAVNIDSMKDIQIFSMHYQAQGYVSPMPVRYENYYLEGKCKEVLFGGSLESYAIEHNKTVPMLVTKCIDAIESMGGLQKEGLYRVSGRQSNIEQLKHQFELDEEKLVLDSKYDVFTIATVLKMYIRELKRPLFDFSVQSRSCYSKSMPQNQRFMLLENKLASLSLAHRSTLQSIIRHLSKVNANSSLNKMNIQNLALIFTPVIFHDYNQTDDSSVGDWSPEDLFEDLILHFEFLFPIAEENARKNNEHKLNQARNGKSPYSQFSQSNLLYISNPIVATSALGNTNNMLLTQPMNPAMLMNNGPDSPGGPNNNSNLSEQQQQYIGPYPPNLTTIIGTVPPNMISQQTPQRLASQPQPYSNGPVARSVHPTDSNARIIPPRYQSDTTNPSYQQQQQQQMAMKRSTSETTGMQRGSSITHTGDNYNNYHGAISNSNSSSNSPLPGRVNQDPLLTKRNSSTPIQQKPYAPPRQDSLRKLSTVGRVEQHLVESVPSEQQIESPISVTPSKKEVPHPIITQQPNQQPQQTQQTQQTQQPPQQQQQQSQQQQPQQPQPQQPQPQQQHQYYQPELNQDFMLPSVTEVNMDSLLDYYSPVTNELKTPTK